MKRFRIALVGCIIFMLATSIIYISRLGGAFAFTVLGNILSVMAGLIAFLALCWLLINLRQLEMPEKSKKWLFLTLGMFLYFLGELTWMIYEVMLGLDPYPSTADVFWLMGYIPLFIGLIYTIKETKVSFWSSKTPLLCAVASGVTALFYAYLLRPILADTGISLSEKIFNFAYPFLDLVLIVLTITILVFYQKGLLGKPWLFVLLGFALFGIADGLFSYFSWIGAYHELPYYDSIDLLWFAGYWAIALGALYEKSFQDAYLKTEKRPKVASGIPANHRV